MATAKKPSRTETSEQTLPVSPLLVANAELLKKTGRQVLAPRGNADAIRKEMVALIDAELETLLNEELDKAEAALAGNELVQNALAVHGYFGNAPEGAGLCAMNSDSPSEAVGDVLADLGAIFKFIEVGVLDDIDPIPDEQNPEAPPVQPVDAICRAVAKAGGKGIQSHVMTQIKPRPFSELISFLIKYSLLGSQPGREAMQVFVDRVVYKNDDPNCVTAHSPVGALVGKRLRLDAVHIAEPMDGDRNTGDGAKGLLAGLQLMPAPGQRREYREEQRETLAMHGINTKRSWSGVGDTIVVTNRSLCEGGDNYVFASVARLRSMVQAVFHETAEHEIRGAGQRTRGALEKCAGLMNDFLDRLQEDGWITKGRVLVNDEPLVLEICVEFVPVPPVDAVVIQWSSEPPEPLHEKH